MLKPESTYVNSYDIELASSYYTFINGQGPYILNNDVYTKYFQIVNDSIHAIFEDSTIAYDNEPFATTTNLHADGKVDINFKYEQFTDYREQAIDTIYNQISIRFFHIFTYN